MPKFKFGLAVTNSIIVTKQLLQSHVNGFETVSRERETEQSYGRRTLHSPPATTPTQSTTSQRRSVSPRTTTSSTPTDHPPTPPPESSPRPFPTPRRPSRSSPTAPRATIASAPPTWGSAATMTPSRRTRMASKSTPTTRPSSPASPPPSPPLSRLASPRPLETSLLGRRCGPGSSPIRPRGPPFNRTISRIRCWTFRKPYHSQSPFVGSEDYASFGGVVELKLWRPNSAEDADIPDAEMTEEELEPEGMDMPEEEREARERKKESHKEKEKGNAAFEGAIQHYAKAIELDDRAVVYLEMGQIRARTKRDCTEKDHEVERERSRVLREVEERGSERAIEKARKMLLLRGRDEAAAAEEEASFEGGPSRARHRVGRNSLNTIRLEEKEKREKEMLREIIEEADEYKVEFYRRRKLACENNKASNRKGRSMKKEHAVLCKEVKGITANSFLGSKVFSALQNLSTEHENLKNKYHEESESLKKSTLKSVLNESCSIMK
ncbi:clathrin light chain protein [Actinidia rufa]|uniref:Clathrin light chain protein n=1 Tax=Actinidia rufa TaxID=165716 RepID=A0A7J0EEF8_9ERIC|nr:clathrin light chain protein [Actinidia rufa]